MYWVNVVRVVKSIKQEDEEFTLHPLVYLIQFLLQNS